MKKLISILVFLLLSMPNVYAFQTDEDGTPPPLERHIAQKGQTVIDILHYGAKADDVITVDPGDLPEGDYLGEMAFNSDGSRFWVTNRVTNNVTVFAWDTAGVLANIDVGAYPSGLAIAEDYAVVACAFEDKVYVIDLNDYSIAATFDTGEQPWVVRLSPDLKTAYIACDIDNVCEVIDLLNLTHIRTLTDFPIFLTSWSFNSENSRTSFEFSTFEVLPDGNQIIAGDGEENVLIINAETGQVDHTISGIPSCWTIGISGNGDKAVAVSNSNPVAAYQIDLTTFEITGSVTISGYTLMTFDVGVNDDGSKAFIGISNNSSAIVRFETSDYTIFTSTYTPFWIGVSPDHNLAIGGQYRFSIIDFESESLLGQYEGNTQSSGAVSPDGYRVAAFDPHRHEGIYMYEYNEPDFYPTYLGTMNSGLEPEGDAPRRVAITPDGSKAVVTNVLSDNVSIINLDNYTVEAILPIGDRVQDVAITSDSRWAVVCGFNSNSVVVIDLDINAIVADVPAGSRPGVVSLSPDNNFAYAGNISSNTVSVIALDGENSHHVIDIPCGEIGVVWAAYGVSSDVKCSPDGQYVLVAASFDDLVYVIDAVNLEVDAILSVGDFPLQIAFNGDGQYATVTNSFSDSYSIINVDGENSTVVGTFPVGDYPLRLSYNSILDEIGIGNFSSKTVTNVDPESGEIINIRYYSAFGNIIQVLFDEVGEPMVLTSSTNDIPGHLHKGDEAIELPAVPSYFDYCPAVKKAAVAMPGPDYLTVISWAESNVGEAHTIPIGIPNGFVIDAAYPNPFNSSIKINFALTQDSPISLKIYNLFGQVETVLLEGNVHAGRHQLIWEPFNSASGVYFCKLTANGKSQTIKISLLK